GRGPLPGQSLCFRSGRRRPVPRPVAARGGRGLLPPVLGHRRRRRLAAGALRPTGGPPPTRRLRGARRRPAVTAVETTSRLVGWERLLLQQLPSSTEEREGVGAGEDGRVRQGCAERLVPELAW